jgi:hypothetical protein
MSVKTGAILLALAAAAPVSLLSAQEAAWNDEHSMEIIEAAINTRHHAFSDSSLQNFEVDAEGYVYLLTNIEGEERLVRADQVALNVIWQAPDNISQTMVGRRSDQNMPTRIRYHVDHLAITASLLRVPPRGLYGDPLFGRKGPCLRGRCTARELRPPGHHRHPLYRP